MNEKSGGFKPLHSFNQLRVPWIVSHLSKESCSQSPLKGVRIVDVGSGGGLLSMALCRLGADVVGLDASTSAVKLAEQTADEILKPDQRKRISFVDSSVEDFSESNAEGFDAVVASEIVEHVSDLASFVRHCVRLAKSNSRSPLFFTTINKTLMSKVLAVWLAEVCLFLVNYNFFSLSFLFFY